MKYGSIYYIVGKPNTDAFGYVYVGQTTNFRRRLNEHNSNFRIKKKQTQLIAKMEELGGVANFQIVEIAVVSYLTIDELHEYERLYTEKAKLLFGEERLLNVKKVGTQ